MTDTNPGAGGPPPALFFDLDDHPHRFLLDHDGPVWDILGRLPAYLNGFFEKDWPLKGFIGLVTEPIVILDDEPLFGGDIAIAPSGPKGALRVEVEGKFEPNAAIIMPGAYIHDDRLIVGPGTVIESGAMIKGPTVIGAKTEVRQGAYIRGDVLVGDECVVGHTTEAKNTIMMNGAKAGHFAYLGDSILGRDVNLGAGTKLANLKMVEGTVALPLPDGERLDTGRRKLGAILGDGTETGCNSVTSPGTLLGKRARVYPCVSVPAGYYSTRTIIPSTDKAMSLRVHPKAG